MPVSVEQINLWMKVPSEDQKLEFKEAKNQYDKEKLLKYCIAIANEGGGHLLLGITDRPPRVVVGSNAFSDLVGCEEVLFHELGFHVGVEQVLHPDGRIVIFQIPSRPKGTAYQRRGAYYMRAGEALVPMSEDVLRAIFAEGAPDWLEESSKIGMTADEVISLLDTQRYFDLCEVTYPDNRAAVLDKLKRERLIGEANGKYSVSRLGALLLAKDLSVFDDVARKRVRLVVFDFKTKLSTKLSETFNQGYAVGYQAMVKFVMSQLPQNEVIKDALRYETTLVEEIVVRELLANAMIHQDFQIGGTSPMVEIYEDRIEFSNPGKPIVPTDRFIDGYQSRNERMADLMRRLHICEEMSSGIDKVVFSVETSQLPPPMFSSAHNRTEVVVQGFKPFDDMDRNERVRAAYQHCCLRYVIRQDMTNQSLRVRFDLPDSKSSSVSQVINQAIEDGFIRLDESIGTSKRLSRYLPFWG
jgi:predicted HTH transcriptional regulator